MRVMGSAGTLLLAIIVAALTTVTSTMTTAQAATALIVGGTKPTNILPDFVMSALLNGQFADYATRVNVPYPAEVWPVTGPSDLTLGNSLRIGTFVADAAVRLIPGSKTVVGISQGGVVVDEVLRQLSDDPTAPPKDELNFVIIASTTRGNGILSYFPDGTYIPILDYTVLPTPETQYDVIVVTSEYDGWADFPDRPSNIAAVANAIAGMVFVHLLSPFADLSKVPTEDITVTTNSKGGVTTSYFIRSEHLPLLSPLRLIGVPEPLVAAIEQPLKRVVDAGYSRNDNGAVTFPGSSDLSAEARVAGSFTRTVDASAGPLTKPVTQSAQPDPGSASARECCSDSGMSSPIADSSAGSESGKPAVDTFGAASPVPRKGPIDALKTGGSVVTLTADRPAGNPLIRDPSAYSSPAVPPARGALSIRVPITASDAAEHGLNPFVQRIERVPGREPRKIATYSSTTTRNSSTTSTHTTNGPSDAVAGGANTGDADGAAHA